MPNCEKGCTERQFTTTSSNNTITVEDSGSGLCQYGINNDKDNDSKVPDCANTVLKTTRTMTVKCLVLTMKMLMKDNGKDHVKTMTMTLRIWQ